MCGKFDLVRRGTPFANRGALACLVAGRNQPLWSGPLAERSTLPCLNDQWFVNLGGGQRRLPGGMTPIHRAYVWVVLAAPAYLKYVFANTKVYESIYCNVAITCYSDSCN